MNILWFLSQNTRLERFDGKLIKPTPELRHFQFTPQKDSTGSLLSFLTTFDYQNQSPLRVEGVLVDSLKIGGDG